MTDQETMIAQTQRWLRQTVVGHNFCPFARREVEAGSIRFAIIEADDIKGATELLLAELARLEEHPEFATSLLLYPKGFDDFYTFLDLLDNSNTALESAGYEGIYQIASFHPHYFFADSDFDDAANYTNRSPYPMLHLIREDDLEQALERHPDPEGIPDRNIAYARELGRARLQAELESCLVHHPDLDNPNV